MSDRLQLSIMSPMSAFEKLNELKQEKRKVESTIKALTTYLESQLKDGPQDGIIMEYQTRTNVSYKSVMDHFVKDHDDFKPVFEKLAGEHSSTSVTPKFSQLKEEGDA